MSARTILKRLARPPSPRKKNKVVAVTAEEALKRVTALPGVKATFVFDQYLNIPVRDVPGNYNNDILRRIAQQLYSLAVLSWNNGVITQEFRLVYEKYAVYTRLFGQNFFIVVFMERDLEVMEYRQPVGLAVLILEKALRAADDAAAQGAMSQIAQLAEQTLKLANENDPSFVGQARRLCFTFLGSAGRELIDNGIEEQFLSPPLKAEADMRKLVDYVVPRIPHPILQQILQQDLEDLIRTLVKLV